MNRKLVDDELYSLANKLNPYFYKLGFTANMLTCLSIFFTIISMTMFYKDYRILAAIFYFINYYFDCADGSFARKYKMVSDYGDLLDHLSDILGTLLLLIILYIKNKKLLIKLIPLAIILFLIVSNEIGCDKIRQKKENKNANFVSKMHNKTTDYTAHLCLIKSPKFIYFFNNSTVIIIICIIILFYK
jgi:phosphatidylglycerophosphate synthase